MSRPRREIAVVGPFKAPRALTLPRLCQTLRCSRSTVLRRLAEHGYYSSYNHAGKFFTIPEVAHFDSHGLGMCGTARFSIRGTLKDTLACLVQSSPQGMTHEELASLLAVRVHNPLLELTRQGTLHRERVGPTFVYFHGRRTVRSESHAGTNRRPLPARRRADFTPHRRRHLCTLRVG